MYFFRLFQFFANLAKICKRRRGRVSLPKKEKYDEIVSLADWEPEEQVALDAPVPLEDPVYGPIREDVSEPLTVCQILGRMEEKYGIGVGLSDYSDHQHCYLYGWKKGDDRIQIKDKEFLPANEAMLAVLRLFSAAIKD